MPSHGNGDPLVVILDDQKLFGEALQLALREHGMKAVRAAPANGHGLEPPADAAPDVVLVGIGANHSDGVAAGRRALDAFPGAKVMVVSGSEDRGGADESMRAGLHGYLTKNTPMQEFVASIEAVLAGRMVVRHSERAGVNGHHGSHERETSLLASQLTRREREVLELLVDGATSHAIARRLGVSHNTVRTHIQNVLIKLQVHSRLEAAAFAFRHGLGGSR